MDAVKIKTIKKLVQKEDVYNLEVKDHHNFAVNGGFIVHNCIDALRYALCDEILVAEVRVGTRFG